MTDAAEKLRDGLQRLAASRRRLRLEDIWRIFQETQPADFAEDRRQRLDRLLVELEQAGIVRLPSTRALYDRTGSPALPSWVEWIAIAPTAKIIARLSIAWAPELRFACDLRFPAQISDCLKIQSFLAAGGAGRPMVPIKERSIELFGDEKKLDRLKETVLFAHGRLTLELLRCFVVSPPLVFESGPAGSEPRSILVIENHSTYDSFCRWNATSGRFAAIAYGAGDAFRSSVGFLPKIIAATQASGPIFYFGDLDFDGIRIPLQASRNAAVQHLPPILAHPEFYARLIANAHTELLTAGEPWLLAEESLAWLPEPIRAPTFDLATRGFRLAQEWLGYEALHRESAPSRI